MTHNLSKNIVVVVIFDDWPDYFRFRRTRSKSECVGKTRYEIGYILTWVLLLCVGVSLSHGVGVTHVRIMGVVGS